MLTSDIQKHVNTVRLGFVATVNPDGTPNLSPKGTLLALDDENLFFANIASPNTRKNIESNAAAEVNVINFLARKGYRFKAVAKAVTEGDQFDASLKVMSRLGINPDHYKVKEIVILKVVSVAEIYSPAYAIGKKEDDLRNHYLRYYGDNL